MESGTIATLRAVVIRQRALINRKCKELEISEATSEIYKKISEKEREISANQTEYIQELQKQLEKLNKQLKENRTSVKVAIFFTLNAISEGYKFSDEESESLFYQFCDEIGINEKYRKILFNELSADK